MARIKAWPQPPGTVEAVPEYLRRLYIALTEFSADASGGGAMTVSPSWPTSSVTATATLGSTDGTVLVDASGGGVTINLPAAGACNGRAYYIKKVDTTTNVVTIDANGAETIDDSATIELIVPYECALIQSDGTEWWIL